MITNSGPDGLGLFLLFIVAPSLAVFTLVGLSFYAGRRWERMKHVSN